MTSQNDFARRPALLGAGVALVELVGPHHAVDLVAVTLRVVVRNRGPEARDLEHQLGAVVAQELPVVGGLVVNDLALRRDTPA
jgi:hypothetical protein